MHVLVVHCHPCTESYAAALRDAVIEGLGAAGHEHRLIDLYAAGFDPVMSAEERRLYHEPEINRRPVEDHLDALFWAEALVFIYPTWWYGLPAMLKGWFDRVFIPHVAFEMPTATRPMRPKLQHIRKIAVVTTCGAPWLFSKLIGEPGRKTILRGVRALCAPRCRTRYLALYRMDSVSAENRARFLDRVRRTFAGF